jgi:hypothetical protein
MSSGEFKFVTVFCICFTHTHINFDAQDCMCIKCVLQTCIICRKQVLLNKAIT